MSYYQRAACLTCEVEGPSIRRGAGGTGLADYHGRPAPPLTDGSVLITIDGEDPTATGIRHASAYWSSFLGEHEFHELVLLGESETIDSRLGVSTQERRIIARTTEVLSPLALDDPYVVVRGNHESGCGWCEAYLPHHPGHDADCAWYAARQFLGKET